MLPVICADIFQTMGEEFNTIFNVLFILGLSALIVPLVVSNQLVRLDVPLMIALSIIMLVFSFYENFSRTDGLILIAGLTIYIWFLIYQSRREIAGCPHSRRQRAQVRQQDPRYGPADRSRD